LLLCIAFQPFPTSVLGAYNTPTSVSLYALTLCVTGSFGLGIWLYATTGRRLVRHDLNSRIIQRYTVRAALVPLVFLLSVPIAQRDTSLAEYSWVSIVVVFAAVRWWFRGVGQGQ
jgi:hypothetical protein